MVNGVVARVIQLCNKFRVLGTLRTYHSQLSADQLYRFVIRAGERTTLDHPFVFCGW